MEQGNIVCDACESPCGNCEDNSLGQEQLNPPELFTEGTSSFGLSGYIKNMLVVYGYDRLETIAKLNVE